MTDRLTETYRLLELFRPAAPAVLATFRGAVVWSLHNLGWPGFVVYLVLGFAAGASPGDWSASPCSRRGR
jgi:hypothetical protein